MASQGHEVRRNEIARQLYHTSRSPSSLNTMNLLISSKSSGGWFDITQTSTPVRRASSTSLCRRQKSSGVSKKVSSATAVVRSWSSFAWYLTIGQRSRHLTYHVIGQRGEDGLVHSHCPIFATPIMALSTGRLFQLERFRRDLDACDSKDELRKIGHSLLSLYFQQQETVQIPYRPGLAAP